MDIFAHALYGATVCSRSGLAGRAQGAKVSPGKEWTVWLSMVFGVLPDFLTLVCSFPIHPLIDARGHLTVDLTCYRTLHSLLVALAVSLLIRVIWKPAFIASLAWPLHIACDALTHGSGKHQTPLFYPLLSWGFDGIRRQKYPWFIALYWILLPLVWLGIHLYRKRNHASLNS